MNLRFAFGASTLLVWIGCGGAFTTVDPAADAGPGGGSTTGGAGTASTGAGGDTSVGGSSMAPAGSNVGTRRFEQRRRAVRTAAWAARTAVRAEEPPE